MKGVISQGLIVGALAVAAVACQEKASGQKAFETFNEGVAYSLKAIDAADTAQAHALERQAIEKYHETLQADSTHPMARAAMGHSYYLLDKYPEAIRWFEASNKVDSASAPSYRELGLSRISLGEVEPGWADLQRAFHLDTTQKIRAVTADDLYGLGQRAYQFGEVYQAGGNATKGQQYKQYAVAVLQMAYATDRSRKDIGKTLAELAATVNSPGATKK
jgi:tetratricopeptide (TPR) repeat protein